jgi:serine phosphatase RsbU (regulator of sigma subunit)/anti-sigma regulatory factor (Ser/Thr protein kinase)
VDRSEGVAAADRFAGPGLDGSLGLPPGSGLEASRAIACAPTLADAYKALLPALCSQLGCTVSRLWACDHSAGELVAVDLWAGGLDRLAAIQRWAAHVPSGDLPPVLFGERCPRGVGLAGHCWSAGSLLVVEVGGSEEVLRQPHSLCELGLRGALALPLEGREEVLAVITAFYEQPVIVDARQAELLTLLGRALGAVLEARRQGAGTLERLRRQAVVLGAARAVGAAEGYEETIRMLAASAVPGLADLCMIDLLEPDGSLRRVAAVHADPHKAELVAELRRRYPPDPGSEHPAGQVIATGRSSWSARMSTDLLTRSTRDARHLEIATALGMQSYLCVPLRAGEEVLGSITLVSAGSGRVFTRADLGMAEQLAAQVAGALARVRRQERRRRGDERARARARALRALAGELSAAGSLSEALEAVLRSRECSLGASASGLGVHEGGGRLLRVTFAGRVRPEIAGRYHLLELDAPVPIADSVAHGREVVIEDYARADKRYLAVSSDALPDVRASVIEPLRAQDGTVLGALGLIFDHPRSFDAAELAMARAVAATVATATARIDQSEREHEVATALQEQLLSLRGRGMAAALDAVYRPAATVPRIGGDWYTVGRCAGGRRMAVSVGDVVGHGLRAAATMSQLRSALEAAALADPSPEAVLALLDRYARTVPGAQFATVAYGVLDAEKHTFEYACAGHPHPLLVGSDGQVRWLGEGRRPALALDAAPGAVEPAGRVTVAPGSLLVLYTDGLVERHQLAMQDALDRLAAAAARCLLLPVGAACEELVQSVAPNGDYEDDIVVLAIRPVGSCASCHVDCLAAAPEEVAGVRRRLAGWLGKLGVSSALTERVIVAMGEAVNNAIEHGSELDSGRTVAIEAFVTPDGLSLTVSDTGRWDKDSHASRREQGRGRGLRVLDALCDQVEIIRRARGTRVTMSFHGRDLPLPTKSR